MAFTAPRESRWRYRQDGREVSHGHENVAVTEESTPQPGHTTNLRGMSCGGNSGPHGRALPDAKSRGPTKQVRATYLPVPADFEGGERSTGTLACGACGSGINLGHRQECLCYLQGGEGGPRRLC